VSGDGVTKISIGPPLAELDRIREQIPDHHLDPKTVPYPHDARRLDSERRARALHEYLQLLDDVGTATGDRRSPARSGWDSDEIRVHLEKIVDQRSHSRDLAGRDVDLALHGLDSASSSARRGLGDTLQALDRQIERSERRPSSCEAIDRNASRTRTACRSSTRTRSRSASLRPLGLGTRPLGELRPPELRFPELALDRREQACQLALDDEVLRAASIDSTAASSPIVPETMMKGRSSPCPSSGPAPLAPRSAASRNRRR